MGRVTPSLREADIRLPVKIEVLNCLEEAGVEPPFLTCNRFGLE
jgi:hypothetical protein